MAPNKKQNLKKSIKFAQIIRKLKTPQLITDFADQVDDSSLTNFYRIVANLIYSKGFSENPLLRKKLPKLKMVMSPFKREWLKMTQKSTQNPKGKKKFFLQQTGQGNILQIVTSVLPLLLALL